MEIVGEYSDEGHSGKNIKRRQEFMRMLNDSEDGKDDPKYKERYERDVKAGRKFARMCRIDKAAAKVQRFADLHKTLFLVIVFGFVGVSFCFNIYRMARKRSSIRRSRPCRAW